MHSFTRFYCTRFILVAVLLAAITKRAQIPFSSWLPAAIAAPTPVSALVHSSTLVTAGVYLIIRFFFRIREFSFFSSFLFVVGTITCFIARSCAYFENDLKKIIALSTLSQLGVIILSLGIGQVLVRYYHLVTHALFKALLFICAGQVIHVNDSNQDIRLMGGLYNRMPMTVTRFNVANLSLCGIPYLSGFYSKDLIIENFYINSYSAFTRVMIIIRICLTSIYRMRLRYFSLWTSYKGGTMTKFSDERKYLIFSYFLLVSGAIIGGSFLS